MLSILSWFPRATEILAMYDSKEVGIQHRADHVRRMLGRIPILQVSPIVPSRIRLVLQGQTGYALEMAVLLHNLDRTASALECSVLSSTDFAEGEKGEIMTAVLEHSKPDGPNDPLLLSLLRFLDRWDRFSMSGILGITPSYKYAGLYPREGAFAPKSTREVDIEGGGYYASHTWRRVVEWVRMMPEEWMRELAHQDIERFIFVCRWFADEIEADPGTRDVGIEAMLSQALGEHYVKFPVTKLVPA